MLTTVFNFLNQHYDKSCPILLALSGGPDSLALLDVLLELKESLELKLGIAHIDHRWRESSTFEALHLQDLSAKLGIPFHLKTLDPNTLSGNLEAVCREERLHFFRDLAAQHGYQAVLMGHHADDQAETVLKKIFEASSLPYLAGLRPETNIEGLRIWRPLLAIRKKEILKRVEQRSLTPFEDYTNTDPTFLRGKFRTKIIPSLSQEFGKEISPSLIRIASEAQELEQYLDKRVENYLKKIIPGPFGYLLDLQESSPSTRFECRYLLHKFCEISEVFLTHDILDTVMGMIDSGAANKKFRTAKGHLFVDRRRLFAMKKPMTIGEERVDLVAGLQNCGIWTVQLESVSSSFLSTPPKTTDWLSAWKGEVQVLLPEGNYSLGISPPNICYPRTNPISKWWTNAKAPAFFRSFLPVLWKDEVIAHEFLTGRSNQTISEGKKAILIKLSPCQPQS